LNAIVRFSRGEGRGLRVNSISQERDEKFAKKNADGAQKPFTDDISAILTIGYKPWKASR
jgi:hypothetical protein